MRLEHLFDMQVSYTGPIDMLIPFDGTEGQGFGGGIGSVDGERLRGALKWSNSPRLREDGVILPNLTGVISTDDNARILLQIGGYSRKDASNNTRSIVGSATFLSDHPSYQWINTSYAVIEGSINLETAVAEIRLYECIAETR